MGWARSCVSSTEGLPSPHAMALSKGSVSPGRAGGRLQASQRAPSRAQPAGSLILGIQSPELWKVTAYCVGCLVCGALSWQSEYTRTAVPVSTQKDTLLGAVIVFASVHLGVKKCHPQQIQRGKRGHSAVTFWTEKGSPQLPGDGMFYRW